MSVYVAILTNFSYRSNHSSPPAPPPEEIVQQQQVRPLPGNLDSVPVFNSNSQKKSLKKEFCFPPFHPKGKKCQPHT
jgi:hypothetical protein